MRQLREQTQQNIKEVIEYSEACEREKAAAEAEVKELLGEVERLKADAANTASSSEAVAQITELEKLLEAKMLDVEEADEKLLDVRPARFTSCYAKLTFLIHLGAQGAEEVFDAD